MIAIKGMKMPSSCYDCPFAENTRTNDYGSFCECGLLEDCETINLLEHSKHPNCPLVEIVTCKDCILNENNTCCLDGFGVADDYFCASAFCVGAKGESE